MYRIEVNQLGKKYKHYSSHWNRLVEWLTGKQRHEEKWVLKGLTFKIKPGESVGIIGHNGAGKSTLLKILTGTTHPSEGEFYVNGKIAALLELGLGFHPDFTGIQNVYMAAQLMGIKKEEVDSLLPEIEAFAEIGDYIHLPLRTYSSGMAVRLAFATATAVRPDILIVDEALSVGDAYFQHKCFNRIRKFREEGTTLLFVSHDPTAVKNLCDRAILLDRGYMIKDGYPEEVLDYYNAIIAKREADYAIKQSQTSSKRVVTRSGNGQVEITNVKMLKGDHEAYAVQVGEEVTLAIDLKFHHGVTNPTVGFLLKDRIGNDIFGTNTYHLGMETGTFSAGDTCTVSFHFPLNLGIGHYSISVAVHQGAVHVEKNYDWWDQACMIQVVPGNQPHFEGVSYLPVSSTVKCEWVKG